MTGPLRGVRVVMMDGLGPAPFCGMVLGDLGADVIRVDRPAGVDKGRQFDEIVCRNQRSIAIDLKDERGKALVHRLIESADAFVEPYRPGVAERLGIGPDDLLAVNPALVYARMTGWGQDGPLAPYAGHDINYISLSGALHGIGRADIGPMPPLNLVGDYGGGAMFLALGVLSGVFEARQSGQGQVVDVAMIDGAALLMAPFYGMFAKGTWHDRREENVLDGGAHYYRAYECADGEFFSVGAIEPQFYAELCELLDVEIPHHPRHADWAEHRVAMAARFREKTRAEWEAIVVTPQSCATPVLGLEEAPSHPHNVARQTFIDVDGVTSPAPAPRFSRTAPDHPTAPGLAGDHTLAILDELGLDPAELLAAGVVRQSSGR
jgi:alpha-methylacyl-CoA racemase